MPIIIIVTILLFGVLIGWTWVNLSVIEKKQKIIYIVISLIIIYVITLIVFAISKSGVEYQNEDMVGYIQAIIVSTFTVVNGFIGMQYIAKIFGKLYNNEITKEQATKRLIIISVIFLICIIIECGYMKDIQNGILKIYYINKGA